MNYYHDHSRPAPSREYARCSRPVRGTDRRCGEILEHLSNPFTGRVRYDVCPACDQGRARTRWLAPELNAKGRTHEAHSAQCERGWQTRHERNQAIAEALRAGEDTTSVAARHGVSDSRIRQIAYNYGLVLSDLPSNNPHTRRIRAGFRRRRAEAA